MYDIINVGTASDTSAIFCSYLGCKVSLRFPFRRHLRTANAHFPCESNHKQNSPTITMKTKAFIIFCWFPAACPFRASLVPCKRLTWTKVYSYPEKFERAVQCSTNFGMCDADELIDLAEELESYQGSFFEKDDTLRTKEVQDRNDVADVLRKEAELKLRLDYLKNGNLFKEDVEDAVMIKRRDEYLELMDEYSDY